MWGNLKSSIANAGENGIIAKLGDVVAPASHEDDEYESESGSGEYEDEDYEYYDDTDDLDGIDDDDLILEGDEEEDVDFDYEEKPQVQFSPMKLNEGLSEGRAAMGKLLGGVLQKSKAKLNETARSLVEVDLIATQDEEGSFIGESEHKSAADREDIDVEDIDREHILEAELRHDNKPESVVDEDDKNIWEVELSTQTESVIVPPETNSVANDEYEVISEENMLDVELSNDNEPNTPKVDHVSAPETQFSDLTENNSDLVLPIDNIEDHGTDSASDEMEDLEDLDQDITHETTKVEDKTHGSTKQEEQISGREEGEIKEETIKKEEDFIGHTSNNDTDSDVQMSSNETPQEVIPISDNNPLDNQAKEITNLTDAPGRDVCDFNKVVTASASDSSTCHYHEENQYINHSEIESVSNQSKARGKKLMATGIEEDNLIEESLVKEKLIAKGEAEIVVNDSINGFSQNLEMNGEEEYIMENGNDPKFGDEKLIAIATEEDSSVEADSVKESTAEEEITGEGADIIMEDSINGFGQNLQMENGNDPSAIEILDETVGHAFNLQETGLDKTIGHHLGISGQHGILEESKLDETVGHHVSVTLGQSNYETESAPESTRLSFDSLHQNTVEQVEVREEPTTDSIETFDTNKVQVSTLESELTAAQNLIKNLEKKLLNNEDQSKKCLQEIRSSHDEEKDFLLNEAQKTHAEEMRKAVEKVRGDMEKYVLDVQQEMAKEMEKSDEQIEQFRTMFEEAATREKNIETSGKKIAAKYAHQVAEMEKRHSIAMERVEKKASHAMAALDDKDLQIKELNNIIKDMRNTIKQNADDHEAVEDEADELHQENEELKEKIEVLENERKKLKIDLETIQEEHGKSLGVQIELQLLREERDREKEKVESLKETQNSNESSLTAERDAANAAALDLEQRLAALQADLDLVKSDYERSILANSNLQTAMEAFQIERESELALLEESRVSFEEAMQSSNDLALQSMRQENEAAMKEVQIASKKEVQNMKGEMSLTENKLEEHRKESLNLRRSLDEAIHRLQTNQEDVIDRSLMKNILLDWHSKSGKARRDVMVVVASVLHFTESDKDKCGIGEESSTMDKVVGAVAPPLRPAVKTADELDGDNIREKWVNFLLAECGDSPKSEIGKKEQPLPRTKSRRNRTAQSLEL